VVTSDSDATLSASAGFRPAQQHVKEPSPELIKRIHDYLALKGRLYAPVDHPAFASLPSRWKRDRFELFKPYLEYQGGTALDIGSHWGYMAHRLEDMGYKVAANERSAKHLYIMRELRDLSGKRFDIVSGSIFDMKEVKFDVVLALNIFHHFLTTDERFENLQKLLARTKCRMMIYQSHSSRKRLKLNTADRYMEPAEMAKFLADRLSLPRVIHIGVNGGRDVFKLAQ
jgi:2-polyprenyl-3-methyl-5-hydroxy-6-metoxy-1,4-benzoquinol methylase